MNNNILFCEQQKFKQWWIWLILFGTNGLLVFAIFMQIVAGQPFGNKPMSDAGLLITAGITFLFTVVFLNLRLETLVKNDGIYVRFFPFHISFKHHPWETITRAYVREYSPLVEYGGWGLRMGLFGKGMAFNVSGNIGLQLEFTNSKKLLIGTNKAEELTTALQKLGRLDA
jgi:hypothetical protein